MDTCGAGSPKSAATFSSPVWLSEDMHGCTTDAGLVGVVRGHPTAEAQRAGASAHDRQLTAYSADKALRSFQRRPSCSAAPWPIKPELGSGLGVRENARG